MPLPSVILASERVAENVVRELGLIGSDRASLYRLVVGEVAKAIRVEREACAQIAEADTSFMMLQDFGMQSTCTQVRQNIADAIRNRS